MSARIFFRIVTENSRKYYFHRDRRKIYMPIKSGETKFSIIGMPPEEYPDLPTVNAGEGLRLRETSFAV